MLNGSVAVALFVISGVVVAGQTAAAAPQVRVDSGLLAGASANGVESFKGIPFAAPPTGPLRWRAPQPVRPWHGVRNSSRFGWDCVQTPFPGNAAPLAAPLREDCRYLNVWRPAGSGPDSKLPVMVWIHGGGFVNGGASAPVFSGESFARKSVIMVSINYRLGRFGFFAFPALTRENPDHGLLGNYGYMDQLAALRWVQRNIASFGGDPRNVTVFGESAGGESVNVLLSSPVAKGLFERAIIQSGGGRKSLMGARKVSEDQPGLASLESIGVAFAKKHSIEGTGPEALARLRALPAEALDGGLNMATMGKQSDTYGGPSVDGVIVLGSPEESYRTGRQAHVPVIIGATSADIGFFKANTKDAAFAIFGPRAAAARAAYDPGGSQELRRITAEIVADRTMVEPARFVASTLSRQGIPTYEYRFSYVADCMASEWKTGAPHASDVPYVMNTVARRYPDRLTAKDAAIADQINSYWANFARTGNPNGPGLPQWPTYDPGKDQIMDFAANGHPTVIPDPWKARLDLVSVAR
jgi:para-nitrobenzyl esterase